MNVPSELLEAIQRARRILLIAHIMPDGDCIGSLLGLGWALRHMSKTVTLACQDKLPRQLSFLPGADEIVHAAAGDEELIIALDSSDTRRLGSLYDSRFNQVKTANIDHHVTNVRYAGINWVEPVAATAEMCLQLALVLDIPLDEQAATCFLAGIVTDTRAFRTSNTTTAELQSAIMLMEAGASLVDITDQVFKNHSPARLCLWGKALSAVQSQDGIIWTEIAEETLRDCRAGEQDMEGLSSFLDTTADTLVSIVFQEKGELVETSMRAARGVDISGVAFSLGGGGHPQASGCSCTGSLARVRDTVLAATRKALQEQGHLP